MNVFDTLKKSAAFLSVVLVLGSISGVSAQDLSSAAEEQAQTEVEQAVNLQPQAPQRVSVNTTAADARKAATYGKIKRAGLVNIIGGSTFVVTGHVLIGVGTSKMIIDGDESGFGAMGVGVLLCGVGYPWAISGIPLFVVGNVKEKQYRAKTTAYLMPNGIQFVTNF